MNCPDCGKKLDIYTGSGNPHKENTGFCHSCGVRHPIDPPATEADDEGDELAGLKKAELLELAAERGIEVKNSATVAEIREALAAGESD